ncbi:MAG: PRC-barrel domain-containing protein [Burkholderiaceae bacterium]
MPGAPPDPHLRSANEVRGYGMLAQDGEIGEVIDFVIDQDDWSIRYLVADTHKWLPGRKLQLAPAWVQAIRWSDREIAIDLPRASLRTAPQHQGTQSIDKRFEVHLYQHYGVGLKHAQGART